MIYSRCKCGSQESWSSYGVPRCVQCAKCEGTLGENRDDHRPLEPHRWHAWQWDIDTVTGKRSQIRYCAACSRMERRNEQDVPTEALPDLGLDFDAPDQFCIRCPRGTRMLQLAPERWQCPRCAMTYTPQGDVTEGGR